MEEKWKELICAAKAYWIDSEPTGMSDELFTQLENQAIEEDGFYVRDYVYEKYTKGTKTKNRYIDRIPKYKVPSDKTMAKALEISTKELNLSPSNSYCTLKYDGSSIAIYLDPTTGRPLRIVTVGNLNLNNFGIDQTWKLMKFLPQSFPLGIVAVHCEALVDTTLLTDPETARQKANGLINSKHSQEEVDELLTIRAFRYFTDRSEYGQLISKTDFKEVLYSFQVVKDDTGRTIFAPAQIWTVEEAVKLGSFLDTDRTQTGTGTFLNDGWVLYNSTGKVQRALKYPGAGSGSEAIKTLVQEIQWNDQTPKGRDSWSANVLVDPVSIKGSTIRKPSAGSVGKLVREGISPGAVVGIVLANSTIPKVGDVFQKGNLDYNFPICSCGYRMSEKDIFGSHLKCGNTMCTQRLSRMKSYLKQLAGPSHIDLNILLAIDRFKWENVNVSVKKLVEFVSKDSKQEFYNYLSTFMITDLQKKNMDLVWEAGFESIRYIINLNND